MKQILFLGSLTGLICCSSPESQPVRRTTTGTEIDSTTLIAKPDSVFILKLNDEVLQLLKNKNMSGLSKLAHPEKGVLFSPYSHIDLKSDMVFSAAQIAVFFKSDSLINWGTYDGSGEEMQLSTQEYFEKFVYDLDFLNAEQKSFQRFVQSGNTLVNIDSVFNQGLYVDNYFSGEDPQYGGMDWRALRLVFEKHHAQFYLVAIAHGSWTI